MKLIYRLFLLFLLIIIVPGLFAEGTKQIRPTVDKYGNLSISATYTPFATVGCAPNYRLNIHISNVGEKILFGLRGPTMGNQNYNLRKPNGTVVLTGACPNAIGQTGYIPDYTAAVIGPYPALGGYTPIEYQVNNVADLGDWYIDFSGSIDFTEFDFQVVDGTNNPALPEDAINGRVWSSAWQFYADYTNFNYFSGQLHVYSDDGIVTSLKFNDALIGRFTIFCNPYGCVNTGNFTNDRKSRSNNSSITFPGIAQYKVFLNNPDINAYPDGVYGLMTSPPTLIPDPAFPICSGNKLIVVNVNKAGNVEILIDVPYGGPSQDISLYATVVTGTNNIPWDGKDGLGNPVPDGTALTITVNYVNGLTNLPIWDQERNQQGYIVTLVRPINASVTNPKTYWDDTNIGGGNCPSGLNLTGCSPSTIGCHNWGNGGICDNKMINTWWYSASSSTATLNVYHTGTPPVPVALPQYGCGPPWTINLSATVLSQEEVRWWDQPTGGTLLYTGTPYSVTPSTAGVYTYYAEAYNPSSTCTSTTRTSVLAEAVLVPDPPTPSGAPFYTCGPGTVTLTTTNSNPGIRVDWYDDQTPPQKIISGNSFITPVLTSTTIYWARTVEIGSPAGCSSASMTQFTAEVRPLPHVTNTLPEPICSGTLLDVTLTGDLSGTQFTWTATANPPGSVTGFTASQATPTTTISETLVNSATSTSTVTYAITPILDNCSGPPMNLTVAVKPTPHVMNGTPDPICGVAQFTLPLIPDVTGGTFTWTAFSNPPGAVTGYTAIQSDPVTLINDFLTNTTAQTASVTYQITPQANGCPGPQANLSVILQPTPHLTNTSPDPICSGETFSATLIPDVTGGTFTWTASCLPAGSVTGFTANQTMPALTISDPLTNTTFSPATVTYDIIPYANGCSGILTPFTVTVNPSAHVTQPANITACNGGTASATVFTTSNTGGTTTYAWTNDNPSIGLGASGTGNIAAFTALNTGTTPVVATITVTPTFTNGANACVGSTKVFTITVNPTAQVNAVNPQVLCNGQNTSQVNFSTMSTGGTTTYTWVNNTPGIGLAATGTGNIAPFAAVNAGTSPIVATITVTPHFENNSVTCDGPTTSFTITVNPSAQVNQPSPQTVCHNAPTSDITFSTNNTGGVTEYEWTNNTPSIGLTASGSGDIPSFIALNTGTSPVVATITVEPEFENSSVSCEGIAKTFTITVNPLGQVNQPSNQVVCHNALTTLVAFSTVSTGGTTTYNWTNDNTSIGLGTSGTGDILPFTAINTGLSPVMATITVTPFFTNNGVTCQGPVKTFTITVNPPAQVNQPASQVICHNAQTAQVTFTTNLTGGTITYSWTNDTPSIGLSASGNGDIAPFTALNPGLSPVVATILVTPTFTNGANACVGSTKAFTITVDPLGHVVQPANQTVCNNASTASVAFTTTNTGGTTTYAWSNDNTSIGLGASGTGDIAAFTAVNTGTSPVVATITVTPTFTNGGSSCQGPSKSFTITVNPTPGVMFNPASTPTICTGSTASIIFDPTVAGTVFNWTVPSLPPGVTMVNTSGTGNVSEIINNATNIPQTIFFNVMPVAATCSPASPFTYSVVVNPKPTVIFPASPANPQQVCSGTSSAAVALSSSVTLPGVTYAWTAAAFDPVNPTSAITGFTTPNSGNTIPGENIVSSLLTQGVIKYTVTPTFTNAGVGCPGDAQLYQTLVNPSPTVALNPTDPTGQSICSGGTSQLITFTPNATPTIYTWQAVENVGVAGAITSGTTDHIPAQTLTTTGPVQGHVRYQVTPIYQGGGSFTCPGGVSFSTIFVNPNPTPVISGKSLACELGPNETYSTPAIAGHSYSWTVTGGTITSDPTQNQITVTWGPYTVSPGTLVVTETIDATGCVTTTPPYQVVLQQRPIPTLNGPVSVCDGSTGKVYQTETGMSNYEWTIQGGTITSGGGTSNPSATVTWNTVGAQWIQVNYVNALGCPGYPAKKLDVTVNPLPVTTITDGPGPHCEGAPHTYQVPNDPQCSYSWSVSPASRGTIASGQGTSVVTINWLTPGPATIAVTGTNNITTCVNSSNHAVTVNPKPLPTFNACFDLIATPSSRKFILRGATPWVTGQGVFSGTRVSLNTATGNYEFDPFGASAGTYPITYTFTNNFGCVNQAGPVNISVVNTSFSCGAELTDPRDGRKYRTSLIGGKCWMAENLAYGSSIDPVIAMTDNCVNERYCLNSDPSCTSYGALYQWDELMKYASTTGNQGLCPPEWHVPTETEWQQLIDNISVGVPPPANGIAGGFLKDMVLNPGFYALMKGMFYLNNSWAFTSMPPLTATLFWTSTASGQERAVARGVNNFTPSSQRYAGSRGNAFSVRCVKD